MEFWLTWWHGAVEKLPFEWAGYGFMRLALLAVLLVSPLMGLMGTLVVNNRMAFFSEAVGHAAFTGIALGVLLGLGQPLWAMTVFAVLLAVLITWLRRRAGISTDTVIGLVMAFTVSLGIVVLSRGGNFSRYLNYVVGDLLSITPGEVAALGGLAVVAVVLMALFYNRLLLAGLSGSLARSRGVNPWSCELLFACLLAVVVTWSLPWIGILVINSLLILPAAAARNAARSVAGYVALSVGISVFAGVAGLVASFYLSTATGATIVLVAMVCYLLTFGWKLARGEGAR